jgi:hypothetical protein
MVHVSWSNLRAASFILFILTIGVLASLRTPLAKTQTSQDVTALSHEAFTQISGIYRVGGQAPQLVAKLNDALDLIQQARLRRSEGDEAGAARLEQEARAEISDIMNEAPAAYQKARRDSTARTYQVIGSIPLVVALSTCIFYLGLRTWRWYEKIKLFEMRIVEKKKD